MNFEKLERNVIESIKEGQIKLGYQKETLRLYYPLASLNQFLEEENTAEQMEEKLQEFSKAVENRLGKIRCSRKGERFCLAVPPEGMQYVHEHTDKNEFLVRFIEVIRKHDCSLEDIIAVFSTYSSQVHVEKIENGEFDYLIFFEDGVPDDFRYCFTFEECHAIYHRFTPADYKELLV